MHQLSEVTIRSISVSEMDNNVYLLTSRSTGAQVLIDAADDAPAILALLADAQEDTDAEARLALIITTHSHWDHVRALEEVREATKARTAAGADDVEDIPVPTDVLLQHHDVGSFEGFELEAIHLRGHTPGSVALLYRDPHGPAHLFTGDSLFPGGVGRTTTADDFDSLIDDVTTRVFDYLPDDTVVHPGHGAGTTLGAERPHLPEWLERRW
ncbi:glyoxylase-like metal-dependent hydrolase (beta-lactamase superfamily II) [Arthrobacter sp. PL16]|uniref:MBL fold metallo-hydrolase n=1 Tax=Arthrobacter sp. PL16 TaxID=3071720 RepID=UPI002E0C7579|nr:glyoxylase-like metal-dependent hydrolase (beta-lactamase superfamily II) [Arthrobacter sp. PL16]